MIPYGKQTIDDDDIQAVCDVLRSDFLTQGPVVPRFEQAVSNYTGGQYSIAVNSGTAALHVACKALGLGPGDVLWTSPITFVASANCALYCGAGVDFVDIDPITWNMSVDVLEKKLKAAEKMNRLPKIVVPVHLCGLPCDMEVIHELSRKYGFHIIEDACHAIGGKYHGAPIGSCKYSDITVFSFHPVKTITTGEGGMAVTNNNELSNKMKLLRSHGITREPNQMTQRSDGPWYYQQIELGFNYRMTDIQAALGVSQLKRLDEFVARRHEIANKYDELLSYLPLKLPARIVDRYSGMHLYVIRVKKDANNNRRQQVYDFLHKKGIGVNIHYIPVYKQPYYEKMGFNNGDFKEAEFYYKEALSIPMFPLMTDVDVETIVAAVRESVQ